MEFNWNRSETIALSKESCTRCAGYGMYKSRGSEKVCNCVLRGIFTVCYRKFKQIATSDRSQSYALKEHTSGPVNRVIFGRKNEEFLADFCNIAKRTLVDAQEQQVFKFHFLLGADWKLCCRRMNIDRGTFFHIVYRVQQKLGAAFRTTQPYGIFPLDEYFGNTVRTGRVKPTEVPTDKVTPVRPPLAA